MLYPQAAVGSYNREQVKTFQRSQAAHEFLSPIGLSCHDLPPAGFVTATPLTEVEEGNLFRAFHYLKYRAEHRHAEGHDTKVDKANLFAVRDRLINANLALMFRMVRANRGQSEFDELLGEAQLALIRCVCGFDPWRGRRFHKYACVALLQNLLRRQKQDEKYRRKIEPVAIEAVAVGRDDPVDASALSKERSLRYAPLFAGLGTLPARQREVVAYRLSGLKFREIAEKIGTRVSTCHRHYLVAMQKMRKLAIEGLTG